MPDCCGLANNHVLDWGTTGLRDTLEALEAGGIGFAGAGLDASRAEAPIVLPRPDGDCVPVFAAAFPSSSVPPNWAATADRPGVAWLADLEAATLARLLRRIEALRRPDDTVTVSLHWGPNWSYAIRPAERRFARGLIDSGLVDVVHGHSSHHAKPLEIHRGRPILYGCGDPVNDYEGIEGYDDFRDDLSVLYRLTLATSDHACTDLTMLPFRLRRFHLETIGDDDLGWLHGRLDRECRGFGGRVIRQAKGLRALRRH